MPDCDISLPSFTKKDREDLIFGLENDCDFAALSFVRRKEDIQEVKFLLHELRKNIPVIAKIERPEAIKNLPEILEEANMAMVARGDMAVEVGNHLVPSLQKHIILECNARGVPVITATQMLESMKDHPTPTRAEASDVANAVWDGTDALMLSGETAVGAYSAESIKMMGQIIEEAEKNPRTSTPNFGASVHGSIMMAASTIAENINAKKILSVTESGYSCLKISALRPKTEVLGITNKLSTVRHLCLYWGITPYLLFEDSGDNFDFQRDVVNKVKQDLGLANGDKLVITRGDGRFFSKGSSHSVKVETVKGIRPLGETLQEAKDSHKRILFDLAVCAGCQNCTRVCPHDIWQVSNQSTVLNPSKIEACALLAQSVEQGTENPCVRGSIPREGTNVPSVKPLNPH